MWKKHEHFFYIFGPKITKHQPCINSDLNEPLETHIMSTLFAFVKFANTRNRVKDSNGTEQTINLKRMENTPITDSKCIL